MSKTRAEVVAEIEEILRRYFPTAVDDTPRRLAALAIAAALLPPEAPDPDDPWARPPQE